MMPAGGGGLTPGTQVGPGPRSPLQVVGVEWKNWGLAASCHFQVFICFFLQPVVPFARPCAGAWRCKGEPRSPWEPCAPEVRAPRGCVLEGLVTSPWGSFQPQASPPVSSLPPATTAVPPPPSSAPICAGGSGLKDGSGNEERSGRSSVWKASPRETAEAAALRELSCGGDCSVFACVLIYYTWRYKKKKPPKME